MTLHVRAEWTDASVRYKEWLVFPPRKVIVHHSGGDGTFGHDLSSYDGQVGFMNSLYQYGMERDGAGTEYNDVLLAQTEWWEGFGPTVPGAHCVGIDPDTGQKASLSTYGICVWGDFTNREISPTEFDATVQFLQHRLAHSWLAPDVEIYGHRDYAATGCPGSIYERLIELEEAVHNTLPPSEEDDVTPEDKADIARMVWEQMVRNQAAGVDQPAGQLLGWTHLEAANGSLNRQTANMITDEMQYALDFIRFCHYEAATTNQKLDQVLARLEGL